MTYPIGRVAIAEITIGEGREVLLGRAVVVVDHVEDHADPEVMRPIHEASHVIGLAVEARRGKKVDPVVAPAKAARELGKRHQLDHRDSQVCQFMKLFGSRGEVALGRNVQVHLVDYLSLAETPGHVVLHATDQDRQSRTGRRAFR